MLVFDSKKQLIIDIFFFIRVKSVTKELVFLDAEVITIVLTTKYAETNNVKTRAQAENLHAESTLCVKYPNTELFAYALMVSEESLVNFVNHMNAIETKIAKLLNFAALKRPVLIPASSLALVASTLSVR